MDVTGFAPPYHGDHACQDSEREKLERKQLPKTVDAALLDDITWHHTSEYQQVKRDEQQKRRQQASSG